jgi:organic radical activating enzyme
MGRCLHWVTITGGEPSLREDISDVLVALVARTALRVITLATNGLLVLAPDSLVAEVAPSRAGSSAERARSARARFTPLSLILTSLLIIP